MRPTEVEVARPVVAHFKTLGTVFPEVCCWAYGDRADIVCRRADGSLDVCEVKVAPSLKLVNQIGCWKVYATRAWVAYIPPRRGAVSERWSETFRREGVGVIHVYGDQVTIRIEAVPHPTSDWHQERLAGALSALHEDYAEAGNADSRYLTAFRVTCSNLRDAIAARPGITMKEAVGGISHHYTTEKVARASLLAWIRQGKVEGVETRPIPADPQSGRRAALGLYLSGGGASVTEPGRDGKTEPRDRMEQAYDPSGPGGPAQRDGGDCVPTHELTGGDR